MSKEFKAVTMGVDVFADKTTFIIRGWDEDVRSIVIGKDAINGTFRKMRGLDALRDMLWHGYNGQTIDLALIDAGNGLATLNVHHFCFENYSKILPAKCQKNTAWMVRGTPIKYDVAGTEKTNDLVLFSRADVKQIAQMRALDPFHECNDYVDAEILACTAALWLHPKSFAQKGGAS